MTRGLRGWLLLAALVACATALALRLPPFFAPAALPPLALPYPSNAAATALVVNLPVLPEANMLAPAFARPPLHGTRRPFEQAETLAEAPAPPAPLDAVLWGIVDSGDERYAVLAESGAPEGVRVRVGDLFEGWLVTAIDDAEIVLKRDDRTEAIRLAFGPAPSDDVHE